MLQSESIPGVYLIPSSESSFIWYGVIFVRKGIYRDGVFRFNISIPSDYPNTAQSPTVIFQSELFHPSVCPFTGTLDISDAFPKWISSENHLWQVAKYIIYLFEYPDQGKINYKEAFELWNQNRDTFLEKVAANVRLSCDKIYDPPPTDDPHYITFAQFDEELHQTALNDMKNKNEGSL